MKTPFTTITALALSASSACAQLVADGGSAIINGVTTNLAGDLIVGTNAGNTTLILTNGGRVNSSEGYIGTNSSDNLVRVIGSGSVWSNSGDLHVGSGGSGNGLGFGPGPGTGFGSGIGSVTGYGSGLIGGTSGTAGSLGSGKGFSGPSVCK